MDKGLGRIYRVTFNKLNHGTYQSDNSFKNAGLCVSCPVSIDTLLNIKSCLG